MAQKKEQIIPRRGEVYLVNFDPTVGVEIKKTRPALVLQNDIANKYSPIVIVAAITSYFGEQCYPTEVLLKSPEGGLRQDSVVLLNQIRSIDTQRLIKRLGILNKETIASINRAIEVSLGLIWF